MLNRYAVIAFLFLAYSIVLGHSIVPHHHHDEDHLTEQTGHQHDHDADESDMEHAFENYLHSDGSENTYHQPGSESPVQQIASAYLICHFNFQILPLESPPPVARHSNDQLPVLQHSLNPKGLRAPPLHLA